MSSSGYFIAMCIVGGLGAFFLLFGLFFISLEKKAVAYRMNHLDDDDSSKNGDEGYVGSQASASMDWKPGGGNVTYSGNPHMFKFVGMVFKWVGILMLGIAAVFLGLYLTQLLKRILY